MAASQKVKPEERFVLLRKATDLAAEGGDVTLVLNATRRAGEEFDFDFLASQEKALARIALGPMDAARVKALLTGASQGVEQALAAGRGEVALEFAGLARQVSQRKEGSEFALWRPDCRRRSPRPPPRGRRSATPGPRWRRARTMPRPTVRWRVPVP